MPPKHIVKAAGGLVTGAAAVLIATRRIKFIPVNSLRLGPASLIFIAGTITTLGYDHQEEIKEYVKDFVKRYKEVSCYGRDH